MLPDRDQHVRPVVAGIEANLTEVLVAGPGADELRAIRKIDTTRRRVDLVGCERICVHTVAPVAIEVDQLAVQPFAFDQSLEEERSVSLRIGEGVEGGGDVLDE